MYVKHVIRLNTKVHLISQVKDVSPFSNLPKVPPSSQWCVPLCLNHKFCSQT